MARKDKNKRNVGEPPHRLTLRSSTTSDVGYVRSNNQDSTFAGTHTLIIADGMGGHAGGDTASSIAVRSLAHLEKAHPQATVESIAITLVKSVLAAHDAIVGKAKKEPELSGMGTTVDTVVLVQGYWVLAHIGDSRSYLLHDGELVQMTKDHSYVQHLVDTGRITQEEAKTHPQRNVVMRVLGDFDIDPRPDVAIRRAQAGDRWLLCSDGLCGALEDETIRKVMQTVPDRERCAQKLVNMALKAGSTDNVSAVIGDALVITREHTLFPQIPLIGGAASTNIEAIADIVHKPVATAPVLHPELTPASKAAELRDRDVPKPPAPQSQSSHPQPQPLAEEQPRETPEHDTSITQREIENFEEADISSSQLREDLGLHDDQQLARPSGVPDTQEVLEETVPETGEIPVVVKKNGDASTDPNDPEVERTIKKVQAQEEKKLHQRKIHHRIIGSVVAFVIVAALVVGGWFGWNWSQSQYYVGESNGVIAVYQGIPTSIFGWELSHPVEEIGTPVSSLPQSWQDTLSKGITDNIESRADAVARAQSIAQQAAQKDDRAAL
jgi:protein phosphatase